MTLQPSSTPLSHFTLASFDIFGTLIDWETGICTNLLKSPYFTSLPSDHELKSSRKALLEAHEAREKAVQSEQPDLVYSKLLAEVYRRLVADYSLPAPSSGGDAADLESAATTYGNSVGTWPAFPDTVAAMQTLGKYYKLVPLSNVDRESFSKTLSGPLKGVEFTAIYTAQDVGSYKPDPRNFEYLMKHCKEDLGTEKGKILHVAQSLFHDHVPAAKVGLENVWVDREGVMGEVSEEIKRKATLGWKVATLGELAEMAEKSFREQKS
ncbi:hypothetical protein LTS18_003685 [Coniosporium uncinatum]|uniref:Uncharacterized protein n=1 Tax=Coniosporium uncinatum TaxID=93489 RepID=A0ACC3DSX9_9PEZI|nr:hypothetical protein LTS18_003685 [Coniosporium uncinatum]